MPSDQNLHPLRTSLNTGAHSNKMEVVMTTGGVARVPSPDSACEQDWTPTGIVQGSKNRTTSVPTTSTLSGEKQVPGVQRNGDKPEHNGAFLYLMFNISDVNFNLL
ncbi:uncharacterized protein LOC111088449 [Limulus polyphemus]|uniref:Uncharacterized protein LOC111088449 n=1 Tax=Limulus polyphemus TaxID=6850 RepID=A0ABM1TEJ3_LIMPO|nr:uncharacterized protein LOC111088449 [Limulus polyphemus]